MRVIIDTNVFMSGIFWSGYPEKILRAWQHGKLDLVLSADILEEYIRVGQILSKKYKEISASVEEIIEYAIINATLYNTLPLTSSVCRDPKDDMFIACALSSKTKVIVSGDSDLLVLSDFQDIQIIKPRSFYENYLH